MGRVSDNEALVVVELLLRSAELLFLTVLLQQNVKLVALSNPISGCEA